MGARVAGKRIGMAWQETGDNRHSGVVMAFPGRAMPRSAGRGVWLYKVSVT